MQFSRRITRDRKFGLCFFAENSTHGSYILLQFKWKMETEIKTLEKRNKVQWNGEWKSMERRWRKKKKICWDEKNNNLLWSHGKSWRYYHSLTYENCRERKTMKLNASHERYCYNCKMSWSWKIQLSESLKINCLSDEKKKFFSLILKIHEICIYI